MRRRKPIRRRSNSALGVMRPKQRTPPREPFIFEELDEINRGWMLSEFRDEQSGDNPYRSPRLAEEGLAAWVPEMEMAIRDGNEVSLAEALHQPRFWRRSENYARGTRTVPWDAYYSLAITEFNTWYVRGLAQRLIEERVPYCEVYRAAPAAVARAECGHLEDEVFLVRHVYEGHRARYWPPPGDPAAFSIPTGVNCHHTIRRSSMN